MWDILLPLTSRRDQRFMVSNVLNENVQVSKRCQKDLNLGPSDCKNDYLQTELRTYYRSILLTSNSTPHSV